MYEKFYKLQEKPFSLAANPNIFYPGAKAKLALTYLQYGISEYSGFILISGDTGTGKTTLIKLLLKRLQDLCIVGVLFTTNISALDLLTMILQEFKIPIPEGGKVAMREALLQFLIQKYREHKRVLLIIDEAQNLSTDTLEEVRMLSNLQTERNLLLQVILVGHPELQKTLKSREMGKLAQRIAVSYDLGSLSPEETKQYIVYRLKKAGAEESGLFSEIAVEQIHRYSGGIPRLINILCDTALVYGYADGLPTIDVDVIEEVVKERQALGLLPSSELASTQQAHGEQDLNTEIMERVQRLELQVHNLSFQQGWLVEQLERSAANYRDEIVKNLKSRLMKERVKNRKLLSRCESLEQEVDEQHPVVPVEFRERN